mgnify:FL=1
MEEAIRPAYVPADEISVVRDVGGILYGTAAVNNTNRANIKINVDDGHAYINCCLDNLGKGAASQGIENMKLMLGM